MEKVAKKLDIMFQTVYLPAFMSKLASRGIKITTQEELDNAIKLATYLKLLEGNAEVADQTCSPIVKAASALETALAGATGQADSVNTDVLKELDKILKS